MTRLRNQWLTDELLWSAHCKLRQYGVGGKLMAVELNGDPEERKAVIQKLIRDGCIKQDPELYRGFYRIIRIPDENSGGENDEH